MADPICRWRNTTPETVRLLVELLPKTEMSEADYKKQLKENCRAKGSTANCRNAVSEHRGDPA